MITIVLNDSLAHKPCITPYSLPAAAHFDEVYSTFKGRNPLHGFVLAAHYAFANHLELRLKPDDFWTLVVMGLSEHIAMEPDKYTQLFPGMVLDPASYRAKHPGVECKLPLDIELPHPPVGQQWESILPLFHQRIAAASPPGSTLANVVRQYSTTLPINTLIYQSAVLTMAQDYFYLNRVKTDCGIRKVTLLGEKRDWQALLTNLYELHLERFGLTQWYVLLRGLFENFISMHDGITPGDVKLWKNFYKYGSHSGNYVVNGWITILFPYLGDARERRRSQSQQLKEHPSLWKNTTDTFASTNSPITTDSFGTGLNKTTFQWKRLDTNITYNMLFMTGFDVPMVSTTSVETRYGYLIAYDRMQSFLATRVFD